MDQKEDSCFVCNAKEFTTIVAKEATMHRCKNCGAMWQSTLHNEHAYKEIYDESYYKNIWGWSKETDHCVAQSKFHVSKNFITLFHTYKQGGTILEVGCGLGYLLSLLQKDSFCYDVYGIEISSFAKHIAEDRVGKERIFSSFEECEKKQMKFDAVVFFDSLEHIPDQNQLFKEIDAILTDDGVVLVIMPDCSSFVSKIMDKYWFEYKKDHVIFYSKKAFRIQTENHGFNILHLKSTWKTVTLFYVISYLSVFRIPLVSSVLEFLGQILPVSFLNIPLSFPIGQMVVVFERNKKEEN
jgi:2-polyprenyl-3-methyl-5-hydroxy-6-metoxy-1,4-benzoquinol methylase